MNFKTFNINTVTESGEPRTIMFKYSVKNQAIEGAIGLDFVNCNEVLECVKIPGQFTASDDNKTYEVKKITSGLTGGFDMESIDFFESADAYYTCSIKKLIIGEGINYIGPYAFSSAKVREVVIESAFRIDMYAFSSSTVEKVTINSMGTGYIGLRAFSECVNLKDITIPASFDSIADKAFNGCSSLESISWPARCREISDNCFFNCPNLKNININNEIIDIYGTFEKMSIKELDLSNVLECNIFDSGLTKHIKIQKPIYGSIIYQN